MKYKMVSKANTSGYKRIEEKENLRGFPEINLFPVEFRGKIYVPTGYVCYEEQNKVKNG